MPNPYTNGIMPKFGVTVPPGDALNTTDADIKGGLQPTFFADGCRFYVEAASVNGIISEILNAVNCMDLEYDPNRLDNLCLAIKAATQPPNGPQIAAAICGNQSAQNTLATCLIQEIAEQFCENDTARDTFAQCFFTNTLTVPELIVSCILSDGPDHDSRAIDALAQGIGPWLVSADAGNNLEIGSDGRLFSSGGGGSVDNNLLWTIRVGIGQVYMVDTSMTGNESPPVATPAQGPVFIELTSGLTGPGQYNRGKIDNENTVGNYPTNVVTGRVSLASSPMLGQVVHMLNTEGAMLRPRDTQMGQLQQDQLQWHVHTDGGGSGPGGPYAIMGAIQAPPCQFNLYGGSDTDCYRLVDAPGAGPPQTYEYQADSQPVRTGLETRSKNLAVRAFMRIR